MTFYQNCMGICIGVIIFSLCINFVGLLGVFPISSDTGIAPGDNTNETMSNITGGWTPSSIITGILNIVTPLAGAALIGGLVLIIYITHSPAVIGAYLFITIFWFAYLRAIAVLASLDVLSYAPIPAFVAIFTVVIGIVFIAAVIGMFTGSG